MLRKKLILILGSLVFLMVVATIATILLLQSVVEDLDRATLEHSALEDTIVQLDATITQVELDLRQLQLKSNRHLDEVIESLDRLHKRCDDLAHDYAFPEGKDAADRLSQALGKLEHHVSALATTEDAMLAAGHMDQALAAVVEVRKSTQDVGELLHTHVAKQSQAVTGRFRLLVQGLAVLFLILINVSALVLLRVATMVLRPVEQLVEASRQLAGERFNYRVEVDQQDEFQELARSYNHLAAQLESNEQRKLQMLSQVALTLNHELNNAGAIIELQLKLLGRQAGGSPTSEAYLRQIHESLARMTRTVESLKKVRRIVLTDYVAGMKMLDLERSVEEDVPAGGSD
jgi:nitrate/nitrite-specific signal transduction histidine kinase